MNWQQTCRRLRLYVGWMRGTLVYDNTLPPVSSPSYHAPLHEECLQHHGHKGDPGVTPGTCGAISERAQVILVWVRPWALKTPPTHRD